MMKKSRILNSLNWKLIVLMLFTGFFAACNDDDEDNEENDAPPAPQEISFQIDLIKIVALDIKDAENDELEVYGSVNSKLVRDNITEENVLLSIAEDDYIAVSLTDTPLNDTFVYTVLEENVEASTLQIIVSLSEKDFSNANEFLGSETISTPLSAITNSNTLQVTLNDSSGQEVQLTYSVTRI